MSIKRHIESAIQHPRLNRLYQLPTAAECIKLGYYLERRFILVMTMKYSAIAALLLVLLNGHSLPKTSIVKLSDLVGWFNPVLIAPLFDSKCMVIGDETF